MEFIYKLKIDDNCDEIITKNLMEEMFDDMNDIEDYEEVNTVNVYTVYTGDWGEGDVYSEKQFIKHAESDRSRRYADRYPETITTAKQAKAYLEGCYDVTVFKSVIEV